MSGRLSIIALILAIVAFFVYNSIFVVSAREQAIVLRFGSIVAVETEPGLYFKLPFPFFEADNVRVIEARKLSFSLDDIRVQVSGGKFYEVNAFVVYHIADARRFAQSVSADLTTAEQRMRTRLDSGLRRVYGLRGFEAALSAERAQMMREVRDFLRPPSAELGIEIDDVRIRRTDLTKEVSDQTYERMKSERLAEAEFIRARGRERAQTLKAKADREVISIRADAQREGEILRGQGDAERNGIYADAFTRDQGFFEFYRSMAAYRQALEESGTTMVLSPDSEFFRYFKDPTGQSMLPERGSTPAPAPGQTSGNPTPGQVSGQ